jgi:hypothetical protein
MPDIQSVCRQLFRQTRHCLGHCQENTVQEIRIVVSKRIPTPAAKARENIKGSKSNANLWLKEKPVLCGVKNKGRTRLP